MKRSVVGVVAGVIFAAVAIFLIYEFMPTNEPVPPQAAKPAPAQETQVASTEPAPLVPLREPTAVEPSAGWRGTVPAGVRVRVSNGTGRPLMGSRFANYFRAHGLPVNMIRNANSYEYPRTLIFYNPDQRDNAIALAATLPFPVRMAEAKVGRGEIEFVLGFDLVTLDEALKTAPPA
jgi:hypothetical protein